MRQDYQDRIDNYLTGRMTDAEREAFGREVTNSQELQEQVAFSRDVQAAFKSRGTKMDAVSTWREDYLRQKRRKNKSALYSLSGLAAVFIAGVFVLNISHSGDDAGMEPDGNGPVRGGAGIQEQVADSMSTDTIVANPQKK